MTKRYALIALSVASAAQASVPARVGGFDLAGGLTFRYLPGALGRADTLTLAGEPGVCCGSAYVSRFG